MVKWYSQGQRALVSRQLSPYSSTNLRWAIYFAHRAMVRRMRHQTSNAGNAKVDITVGQAVRQFSTPALHRLDSGDGDHIADRRSLISRWRWRRYYYQTEFSPGTPKATNYYIHRCLPRRFFPIARVGHQESCSGARSPIHLAYPSGAECATPVSHPEYSSIWLMTVRCSPADRSERPSVADRRGAQGGVAAALNYASSGLASAGKLSDLLSRLISRYPAVDDAHGVLVHHTTRLPEVTTVVTGCLPIPSPSSTALKRAGEHGMNDSGSFGCAGLAFWPLGCTKTPKVAVRASGEAAVTQREVVVSCESPMSTCHAHRYCSASQLPRGQWNSPVPRFCRSV